MLGSVADAEDALQHTFIAAHQDIQRHDRRDLHVKAWLYTIARNRCLSMLRARREHASEEAGEVVTDNLVHDIESRDDLRALLADITKLPDDQREALVLAEVGDLSHSDISDILGCEVAKVKSLVFQARTALIDRRTARDTSCEEIREQLATLRGGALRRSHLRHHLEACPGCSEYREQIRRQRAMLALALPVVPSAALRSNVLSSLGLGGGTAAAATSGAGFSAAGGIGAAAKGGALAKVGIAALLAAGGAGGATVANDGRIPFVQDPPAVHKSNSGASGASVGQTVTTAAESAATQAIQSVQKHKVAGSKRSAKGTEHGFTPVPGGSNGERAREFAKTRGRGKQISAAKRHVTAHTPAKRARPVHVKRVTKTPPKSGARTAPAPTRTESAPAPKTSPEPAPQEQAQTSPTPAPDRGTTDGTSGKTLGTGKQIAATG